MLPTRLAKIHVKKTRRNPSLVRKLNGAFGLKISAGSAMIIPVMMGIRKAQIMGVSSITIAVTKDGSIRKVTPLIMIASRRSIARRFMLLLSVLPSQKTFPIPLRFRLLLQL